MTEIMEGQVSIFDPDSQYGKMFAEQCGAMPGMTSGKFCKRSQTYAGGVQFLNLKSGCLTGALWETVGALHGESLTPVILANEAFRKEGKGYTLLQILQANAPKKYCLSKKACEGILRRAKQRGRTLPGSLVDAMKEVIGSNGCDCI